MGGVAITSYMSSLIPEYDFIPNGAVFNQIGNMIPVSISSSSADRITKCFLAIWTMGVILIFTVYGVQYFRFRKVYSKKNLIVSSALNEKFAFCKEKIGMSQEVMIYYSNQTETPFTFGVFKPRIIFPLGTPDILDSVIIHELTHCRRYDMLIKTINECIKAFQWFNPMIYLYIHDLENLCEISCDEEVAALLSFAEIKNYAHEIIKNARRQKYPVFLTTFSSYKNYKMRLQNLFFPSVNCQRKGKALITVLVLLIICMGTVLLRNFDQWSMSAMFSNVFFTEESQIKTIRTNYPQGETEKEYYYEEYIDGYWWRGTLLAEKSRSISDNLVEITFSGELYKCEE